MKRFFALVAAVAVSLATADAKPPRVERKPHYEWGVVLESQCEHVMNDCIHGEILKEHADGRIFGPHETGLGKVERILLRPDVEIVIVPYPSDGP
jgi:hypothetical protein